MVGVGVLEWDVGGEVQDLGAWRQGSRSEKLPSVVLADDITHAWQSDLQPYETKRELGDCWSLMDLVAGSNRTLIAAVI